MLLEIELERIYNTKNNKHASATLIQIVIQRISRYGDLQKTALTGHLSTRKEIVFYAGFLPVIDLASLFLLSSF